MKTEASDYTVQFEILGSNVLYAEDGILRFSGRRTNNNNIQQTRLAEIRKHQPEGSSNDFKGCE